MHVKGVDDMSGSQLKHSEKKNISALAEAISGYLAQRPHAADTLAGLAKWWVLRQRMFDTEADVKCAADYLVEQGLLEKRTLANGEVLYHAVLAAKES